MSGNRLILTPEEAGIDPNAPLDEATHTINKGYEELGEPEHLPDDKVSEDDVCRAAISPDRKVFRLSELAKDSAPFVLGFWYLAAHIDFDLIACFLAERKLRLQEHEIRVCRYDSPLLDVPDWEADPRARRCWDSTVHVFPEAYRILFRDYLSNMLHLRRSVAGKIFYRAQVYALEVSTPGEFDRPSTVEIAAPAVYNVTTGEGFTTIPFRTKLNRVGVAIGPLDPLLQQQAIAYIQLNG